MGASRGGSTELGAHRSHQRKCREGKGEPLASARCFERPQLDAEGLAPGRSVCERRKSRSAEEGYRSAIDGSEASCMEFAMYYILWSRCARLNFSLLQQDTAR